MKNSNLEDGKTSDSIDDHEQQPQANVDNFYVERVVYIFDNDPTRTVSGHSFVTVIPIVTTFPENISRESSASSVYSETHDYNSSIDLPVNSPLPSEEQGGFAERIAKQAKFFGSILESLSAVNNPNILEDFPGMSFFFRDPDEDSLV